LELWQAYRSTKLSEFSPTDSRHHLASEVSKLIEQLDICLALITAAYAPIKLDPDILEKKLTYMKQYGTLESNEEYFANMPKSEQELKCEQDPWISYKAFAKIRLFTEMFYSVAWRLRQVVNAKVPHKLPNLGQLKAKSISDVRNLLIQHPEQLKTAAIFDQSMVIADVGPILKSAKHQFGQSGTSAVPESIDQGLYLNATEFEQELKAFILDALSPSRAQ
jgi:hypothetical protein